MSESKQRLSSLFEPVEDETAWAWANKNVDFSLNPSYPTEFGGKYDSELLPFWKEPLESLFDPTVRETAILKCSQAGGTENVPLMAIRYRAAKDPCRILYVWGDEKAATEDFQDRIIGGLKCCEATADKLKRSRIVTGRGGRIVMPDMTIAAAWPKNKMAFKRNPWALIVADEFSTYPDMTPDMMRKRCDTVKFSHICWISSPDATMKRSSSKDPIFKEYEYGDQRAWFMKEPKSKKWFKFEKGTQETRYGLKWSAKARKENGNWDLEMVRRTAHYITPGGSKITEAKRMKFIKKGKWIAQNPDAPEWYRSYHINTFYMPFKSGEFGNIAVAFLKANSSGVRELKTFIYEYLAEKWKDQTEAADDDKMYERSKGYSQGQLISESEVESAEGESYKKIYIGKTKAVFGTVDVQKVHQWVVFREWIDGGDSGLIDFRAVDSWNTVEKMANEYDAVRIGVDYGYEKRRLETLEYCIECKALPLMGRDKLDLPFLKKVIDPYEGLVGKSCKNKIAAYHFNTDIFGLLMLDLIGGVADRNWYVYDMIQRDYLKQVYSMERENGIWDTKTGHPQNHLWDCEVMQLVLASIAGLYRHEYLTDETEGE